MLSKIGLLPRLIICIVLGTILGAIGFQPIMAILATFNTLFGQLLTFSIPLIILSFITVGISDIGRGAGKMLLILVMYAYSITVIAGIISFFTIVGFQPLVVEIGSAVDAAAARPAVPSLINIAIPPVMSIMTALVFAFILGSFMVNLEENNPIQTVMRNFADIVKQLISKVIIPLLPIHIAGIFARISFQGQAAMMFNTFARVFALIITFHLLFIFVQYLIAGAAYKISPFKLLKPMISSYMTAIGTQSSAATIPVNLQNVKKLGVKPEIADFAVPLGATIQLSGSTISIVCCSIAVMFMYNLEVSLPILLPFIMGVAIAMVAAPGVPGGAIMASIGMLELTLGFNEAQIALMIALYIAQDSFGTAVNVSGDGAMALFMNRIAGNKTLDYKA
jgi:Na+/H+-dicarboxylate symporter